MSARNAVSQRYRRKAWASRDLLSVMRAFCVDCMGGQPHLIPGCTADECALFHWRMGKGRKAGFESAAKALHAEGFASLAARSDEKAKARGKAGLHAKSAASGRPNAGNVILAAVDDVRQVDDLQPL